MNDQITIRTLHKQKVSNVDIAEQMKCHPNTISNIINRKTLIEKPTRHKPSVFEPQKETIKEWLDKELTLVKIHEKLAGEYHIHGSYDALRRFVKKHIPRPSQVFGVQEHLPGQEIETDFGDIWIYIEEEQKKVKFQGQGFILPYSGKRFALLQDDQKLETTFRGFEKAFAYFGGVPRKVKIDNPKTLVITNKRYELVFNQHFMEFAEHAGFIPNPCTPRKPEQKGAVEGTIKYLQRNFSAGLVCKTRQEAREKLRVWLEDANKKVHGTYKQAINERFNQERDRLQALPNDSFSFFHRDERKVGKNCHINFANNYYSVPFSYVDKQVTVRWNDSVLRIVYEGKEIALHKLVTGQGNFTTVRAHMPPYKIYSETEYQTYHENKMGQIGPNGHQYFIMLLRKQPRYWYQTVRPIYGMAQEFGSEPVNKALGRALSYGAMDIRIIRNILEKKLYEIVDNVVLPEFSDTGNSRNLEYYT